MVARYLLGPAGGTGGGPFDDGEGLDIASVQVFSDATLNHLNVIYQDHNGTPREIQHGGAEGGAPSSTFGIDVIHLERVTEVNGFVGVFDGGTEIFGLELVTNRGRTSGLLGREGPSRFQFKAPVNGSIIGFWGRQGLFLDALGVRVFDPG
jgi:Jacalin-like lectin domain